VDLLRHRRSGFTLIEIMIVIGILGMALGLGMPAFVRTVRKDPLRQAVGEIMEGCSHARAQAILSGEPAELVIEAGTGQILVRPSHRRSEPDHSGTPPPPIPELAGKPPFQGQMDDDIAVTLLDVNLKDRMQVEQARVRFFPNGTSDDFTIVLESPAGVRKVSLDCVTGLPDMEVIR